MRHINCPKLSSYKHTNTHTELHYSDTCVLVSVIYIQLASSKDEQTFVKTLLCYVLYVFDFSALTSPFSQDIPIYIIYIYNNVSFLISIRASKHFRAIVLTETPICRFDAKDEERRALSLIEHRQTSRIVWHRRRYKIDFSDPNS